MVGCKAAASPAPAAAVWEAEEARRKAVFAESASAANFLWHMLGEWDAELKHDEWVTSNSRVWEGGSF